MRLVQHAPGCESWPAETRAQAVEAACCLGLREGRWEEAAARSRSATCAPHCRVRPRLPANLPPPLQVSALQQ